MFKTWSVHLIIFCDIWKSWPVFFSMIEETYVYLKYHNSIVNMKPFLINNETILTVYIHYYFYVTSFKLTYACFPGMWFDKMTISPFLWTMPRHNHNLFSAEITNLVLLKYEGPLGKYEIWLRRINERRCNYSISDEICMRFWYALFLFAKMLLFHGGLLDSFEICCWNITRGYFLVLLHITHAVSAW